MDSLIVPRRAPYPKQLIIDIHSYCNARCAICPYRHLKTKNPMGVMDERLFAKIIDEFSRLSRKHHFQGRCLFCNMGEPFVYPGMAVERIEQVTSRGLAFDIQTNGELMEPEVVDKLKKSGFNGTITVSCHGISASVYKRVTGLDIAKTLKNIEYLSANYPREKILIQSIPCHWPKGEARRLRSYFKQRGIHVRMPLPHDRAGLVAGLRATDNRTLIGCRENRPWGEMVICFDGDVPLCCNDMGRREIVGNLQNQTLEEVWNGELMVNRIEQISGEAVAPVDFICRKCEFGVASTSLGSRLIRNLRYETKKVFFTYLW